MHVRNIVEGTKRVLSDLIIYNMVGTNKDSRRKRRGTPGNVWGYMSIEILSFFLNQRVWCSL